jgi:hypothetical protein
MTPLDMQSEAVGPTGNISSEGVLNQLGRPRMDRVTVLVREAVQNSWDALAPESDQVGFGIDLGTLAADQLAAFAGTVFASVPVSLPLADRLREATGSGTGMRTMTVWDRGTTGLRGPTRADITGEEDEGRDFVDFLRNVGQAPSRPGAGGTYGYGKASLYLASHARTICVYSQCEYRGSPDTRFMAAALGTAYVDGHTRRTGRHWWGRLDQDVVEPLHGDEADEAAASLGLPPFGSELGTTIVILDPVLDERSSDSVAASIVEALLWYCWPKMVEWPDSAATMQFAVTCDGRTIPIPDPRTFPPLQGFVDAMRVLKEGASARRPSSALEVLVEPIESRRPSALLGTISVAKFGVLPRQSWIDGREDDEGVVSLIPASSHHLALMRAPELVVKYVEGPPLASSAVEYGGVFVVDRSVEQAFALSEPPTHDDWLPDSLDDDWHKRYVRISQRRVAEVLQQFVSPPPIAPDNGGAEGLLGSFSDQLGALFLGVEGPGAAAGAGADSHGTSGTAATGGVRTRAAKLRVNGGPRLELIDGRRGLILDFDVLEVSAAGALVSAKPTVLLDGGAPETDPPLGVEQPVVIGWIGPTGSRSERRDLRIGPGDAGAWRVLVSIPSDALVAVTLEVSASDAQA